MTSKTLLYAALAVLLICVSIVQGVHYAPRLPATVASHFGGSGAPNGWMSKNAFLAVGSASVAAITLMTTIIALAIHRYGHSSCLPETGMIPARDEPSTRRVRPEAAQRIAVFTFWFGLLTGALLLVVFQLAIEANLRPQPVLSPLVWIVLGVYAAIGIVMASRLALRLRKISPPAEPLSPEIWFPAKRFGWGWGPPVRWQGWVAIGTWMLALVAGVMLIPQRGSPVLFVPFMLVMVILLIGLCLLKGERPRWRWGD